MKVRNDILKYIEENWQGTVRNKKCDVGTLLGLPYPYSVSGFGEVFQEMYYWGTYFTNVGLILSGRVEQAKNNVDNMLYMINKYGFVPNSNRTWGLVRSQPPFLSEMVKDIYDVISDKEWLLECYKALEIEYKFWQSERMTPCGLNRYFGHYEDYKHLCDRFCTRLKIEMPKTDEEMREYADSFHSGCESGWDFSSRCGKMQHHYAWLCLNSLLYGVEINMAYFSGELGLGEEAVWQGRADERKALMNKLLWNEELGAFCDYNFVEGRNAGFVSAAMLYPLFVGLATPEQAEKTVNNLNKLELQYGLTCCEKRDDLLNVQWDYPHAWPPLQMIAIKALSRYGYDTEAERIARKYLYVAELNFEKHGRLWEKYNGIDGEISVTKEYTTPPMMGWSAATYLFCDCLVY